MCLTEIGGHYGYSAAASAIFPPAGEVARSTGGCERRGVADTVEAGTPLPPPLRGESARLAGEVLELPPLRGRMEIRGQFA